MDITYAAISIAYTVLHGVKMPSNLAYAKAAEDMHNGGHISLLIACDDHEVLDAYRDYQECSEAIAVFRRKYPEIAEKYSEPRIQAEMVLEGVHPWITYQDVIHAYGLDDSFVWTAKLFAPYVQMYLDEFGEPFSM